ncbi:hypothetical protein CFELI_01670 [Corynebacterium felinum]|nr:hypothetical protein CFELI_01670 [Corynebacterium felinum]
MLVDAAVGAVDVFVDGVELVGAELVVFGEFEVGEFELFGEPDEVFGAVVVDAGVAFEVFCGDVVTAQLKQQGGPAALCCCPCRVAHIFRLSRVVGWCKI